MELDRTLTNPAFIDPGLDARAATFENPTGARGRRHRARRPQGRAEPGPGTR